MKRIFIADIRRLTVHDGPGTRTTVFVKGCPLHCLWCHNPETISGKPLLIYHQHLCRGCRKCETVCPGGIHIFSGAEHKIKRENCILCGACAENCWQNALEICGKSYSPEELLPILLKDKLFYRNGGGVTFSGGEPLLYPEFIREIFALLHEKQIHTALDTCGEVPFESFQKVIPVTDMILFDLKGMEPEQHLRNTGRTNSRIHENLRRLAEYDIPIEIRMPVIPGHNDREQEFHSAGKLLQEIKNVQAVKLLAYHAMAREKYHAAGVSDTMPEVPAPGEEQLKKQADILQKYLTVPVYF